ncbi:MAG: peptidoglycan editing factor PgeF [Thermodesulfobacteriota bacterium]
MGWIKSKLLSSLPGVAHGFADRDADGNPSEVAGYFGFSGLATLNQVHGKGVFVLRDKAALGLAKVSEGDAIVTSLRGIGVGISTADCVSILLTDHDGTVAGAVHAGWRGTVLRILDSTLEKIDEEYGLKPSDLSAVIGPSVGKCCYEVGEDVASLFRDRFEDWGQYLAETDSFKYMLDLPGINRGMLEKVGVANIENLGICTKCNPGFFSYRREGKGVGSQLSVIGLV